MRLCMRTLTRIPNPVPMIPNPMDNVDVAAVHHANIQLDDPLVGLYKLILVPESVEGVDNDQLCLYTMRAPPAIHHFNRNYFIIITWVGSALICSTPLPPHLPYGND